MAPSKYEDLPAPLTPAEVNLSSYPWFRHYHESFESSKEWLACKRNPEVGFYKWNLIQKSWSMTPPGSVEDDDDILADVACCDPYKFPAIKELVMTGWVLCSDGRWHNLYLRSIIVETLGSNEKNRNRTSAATEARRAKRQERQDALAAVVAVSSAEAEWTRQRDDEEKPPLGERHVEATMSSRSPDNRYKIGDSEEGSVASQPPPDGGVPLAPEARTALFNEGLQTLGELTGRPEGPLRSYLGKGLKELKDDAAVFLGIIRDAKVHRPADPLAWITAAAKDRAVPKQTWEEKLLEAGGLAGYVPAAEPPTIDHEIENMRLL